MKPGTEILVISLGGACGALSRYYITKLSLSWFSADWHAWGIPIGTLIANLLGCFLIGIMIGSSHGQKNEMLKLGFGIGFLGSLTTFSTFSAETVLEWSTGNWIAAIANAAANLVGCLLATLAGITVGRKLFP